ERLPEFLTGDLVRRLTEGDASEQNGDAALIRALRRADLGGLRVACWLIWEQEGGRVGLSIRALLDDARIQSRDDAGAEAAYLRLVSVWVWDTVTMSGRAAIMRSLTTLGIAGGK